MTVTSRSCCSLPPLFPVPIHTSPAGLFFLPKLIPCGSLPGCPFLTYRFPGRSSALSVPVRAPAVPGTRQGPGDRAAGIYCVSAAYRTLCAISHTLSPLGPLRHTERGCILHPCDCPKATGLLEQEDCGPERNRFLGSQACWPLTPAKFCSQHYWWVCSLDGDTEAQVGQVTISWPGREPTA